MIDHWVLERCRDQINSSDSKYAFKAKHSTIHCVTVVKEVINYYNSNGSVVYGCMLDASKAYDHVNFGRLFSVLLKKKTPGIILRFIYNSYVNQRVKTEWKGTFSKYFSVYNGVKQRSILSPILFNCYLDVLLKDLNHSKTGCYIGNQYMGCVAYADDVTLLSPSISGLQNMLDKCYAFSKDYSMVFNENKTACIKFCNIKVI